MQLTTIEIMGGLGNQLFQIFALLAYSLKNKSPFFFTQTPIQHGARKTVYWETDLLKSLLPFVQAPPPYSQFQIMAERGFEYQPIPFTLQQPRHVRLFGYFQSYKYFAEQQEAIFKLIKLRETQASIKAKTNSVYKYEKTLAIHFRVGDYALLPNHHPLMTLEYYTQALTQFLHQEQHIDINRAAALCETVDEAITATTQKRKWHILYFCEQNDQTYVETQLIQPIQANPLFKDQFSFQCIDHNLADWEQLIVMSLCRHHIIANSTFSWWGAYLGGIPPSPPIMGISGKVPSPPIMSEAPLMTTIMGGEGVSPLYPTTWFGPAMGNKNMSDLFPPHWHKINV